MTAWHLQQCGQVLIETLPWNLPSEKEAGNKKTKLQQGKSIF
jgi:hypothetical protein